MKKLRSLLFASIAVSCAFWGCSEESKEPSITTEKDQTTASFGSLVLNEPHVSITHQKDGISHRYNVLMLIEENTEINYEVSSDGPDAEFYHIDLFLDEEVGTKNIQKQLINTLTIDKVSYELVSFAISPPTTLNNPKFKIGVVNLRGRTSLHKGNIHFPGVD